MKPKRRAPEASAEDVDAPGHSTINTMSDACDCVLTLLDVYGEVAGGIHRQLVAGMVERGYSEQDVDRALKRLGELAGRDAGWL